jgi:hypothetical protein
LGFRERMARTPAHARPAVIPSDASPRKIICMILA